MKLRSSQDNQEPLSELGHLFHSRINDHFQTELKVKKIALSQTI